MKYFNLIQPNLITSVRFLRSPVKLSTPTKPDYYQFASTV